MPTLDAWIGSSDAKLPRAPVAGDLPTYLKEMFAAHLAAMRDLSAGTIETPVKNEVANIEKLGKHLVTAVEAFLAGLHARAYKEFTAGLVAVKPSLEVLAREQDPERVLPAYRMRVSTTPQRFERKDAFHIPLHERRLVGPQRFSVIGLPCLYLGHSAYVCWQEMGHPAFSSVYMAQLRFRREARIRILELSSVPTLQPIILERIAAAGGDAALLRETVKALAIIWPLQAACAIRVHQPQKPFKPEYIVPQLLLQWLMEETEWQGIRYFSTHVGMPSGLYVGANLVLPARKMGTDGYCTDLRAMFELTPVWNWEVALAAASQEQRKESKVGGKIEAAPGSLVDYKTTKFYELESILNGEPVAQI